MNSFKASDSSPVDAWICPPKSEADATNWSAPLLMPAAVLSSVGPAALTDAVTESMAFEEALMASPVFFPMSFEASFMPAAEVFEYANASAAALRGLGAIRGEGLAGLLGGSSSRVGARGGACVLGDVIFAA